MRSDEMKQDFGASAQARSTGLTRRELLAMTAGAALVYGFRVPVARADGPAEPGMFAPNAFIRIDKSGAITLTIPQVEMGQGTYTSLSMILAEELDAEWSRVRVEHAPPDEKRYANPMLGIQATGNSNSIRGFWTPMRRAGATTRARLVEAAARQWQVPASECQTRPSVVTHEPSGAKHGLWQSRQRRGGHHAAG